MILLAVLALQLVQLAITLHWIAAPKVEDTTAKAAAKKAKASA